MSFQNMTFFLLWITKEDILKNVGNRTADFIDFDYILQNMHNNI